jgi:hypothetical protein
MIATVFTTTPTEELINFVSMRTTNTELEIELVQRLTLAMDRIAELEEEYGDDTGGESQTQSKGMVAA